VLSPVMDQFLPGATRPLSRTYISRASPPDELHILFCYCRFGSPQIGMPG
jgi:hypothetical protein